MSEEVKQEGTFKIKKKVPKKFNEVNEVIKVDLTKKEEDAVQEQSTDEVSVRDESKVSGGIQEQNDQESNEESSGENNDNVEKVDTPIQLVEDEEDKVDEARVVTSNETTTPAPQPQKVLPETETQELPEGVEKLIAFMKETGGTLDDYARLNADYSNIDNNTLIREYYRQSKPHLDQDDISLMLSDFEVDEELDDKTEVRKKKIAYKEEVAKAKNFLEQTKQKYYEEIKLKPSINGEQQKALDFFNRYKQEEETKQLVRDGFINTTNNYFKNEFKGFDFKLGDKKFRYGA
mgnify:FL=1